MEFKAVGQDSVFWVYMVQDMVSICGLLWIR